MYFNHEMLSDGKDFIMSLVVSMGYCIEVVGEEGQGAVSATLSSDSCPVSTVYILWGCPVSITLFPDRCPVSIVFPARGSPLTHHSLL